MQVAEALGLVHLPGITACSMAEQEGQSGSSDSSRSGEGDSGPVRGPVARAREHAGSGLAAYADGHGLLTALLCEGPAHHTRR